LWSLLGFPAINLPAGLVGGLPVGLQLAAPQGRDDSLLSAAAWCEERIAFRGLHDK
jgi:amidase